jgi:hypothetical protein
VKSIAAVLSVVLLAHVPFCGQNPKPGQEDIPRHEIKQNVATPLFAIVASDTDKSISIDPMLFLDNGGIRPVPDPCTESPALHDFESQYLSPGKIYSLIFGGAPHGTVSVTSLQGSDWHVKLDSDVRIEGFTMALATDPNFARTQSVGLRRSATPDEQGHAERIAKEILTKRDTPLADLSRMRLTQIAATKLDGRSQLVVSAEVERLDHMGMEYSLFFIAAPHSEETNVIWFQEPKGETDAEALYFLDQLDGSNAANDRIFVRRVFYENYRYEVYRSEEGHWKKEFQSDVFGCL